MREEGKHSISGLEEVLWDMKNVWVALGGSFLFPLGRMTFWVSEMQETRFVHP